MCHREPFRLFRFLSLKGVEMGTRKSFDSEFAFANVSTRVLGMSVKEALLVRIFEFDQLRAFSLSEQ